MREHAPRRADSPSRAASGTCGCAPNSVRLLYHYARGARDTVIDWVYATCLRGPEAFRCLKMWSSDVLMQEIRSCNR
eukprot:2319330-Prymnesium_polylepis.1